MVEGRLAYNRECGRYGLLVMDLWHKEGFHCGESVQVLINGEWVQSRFEMSGREWYLLDTDIHGDGIQYVKARVK